SPATGTCASTRPGRCTADLAAAVRVATRRRREVSWPRCPYPGSGRYPSLARSGRLRRSGKWRNGRRARFRSVCPKGREGSTPSFPTHRLPVHHREPSRFRRSACTPAVCSRWSTRRAGVVVSVALVTGSAGLIGSEAARHFAGLGLDVVGVDNDLRRYFFGEDGSTGWSLRRLVRDLGGSYTHFDTDIRDRDGLEQIFKKYGSDIAVVIHTAAQPSHDWAAKEPFTDFDVNAVGTLNVLENARHHCPDAPFIRCSTNKVYGDRPNFLPLRELETRYEIEPGHPYEDGVTEDMPIDNCLHSIFGASKVAADVMVQESGRY